MTATGIITNMTIPARTSNNRLQGAGNITASFSSL